MANSESSIQKNRTLIIGGGYVGFHVASQLQKHKDEVNRVVTVVDPNPYMTYQPFLPEVSGNQIDPYNVLVSHRKHLQNCELINANVIQIQHVNKKIILETSNKKTYELPYNEIIVCAGAQTRTFPIKGLSDVGIGIKNIEEAIAIRNKLLKSIEIASTMNNAKEKKEVLTFAVVGGGFAGIETITELEDLARVSILRNPYLSLEDIRFVLIEASNRIMPEVSKDQAEKVLKHLKSRRIEVLLNTSLDSIDDDKNITIVNVNDKNNTTAFKVNTLIWCAGVEANKIAASSDLPSDQKGRIIAGTDLRVRNIDGEVINNAWTAGDIAAVPDITGGGLPDGTCVPNAQHAIRQAKVLAYNIIAHRNKKPLKEYKHKNMGTIAGFGEYKGVARLPLGLKLFGMPAWLIHRGYHCFAMPTLERKIRIISGWFWSWILGRDTMHITNLNNPYKVFKDLFASHQKKNKSESE